MDIGTKREPGRELDADAITEVGGGCFAPEAEDPGNLPASDPFGGTGVPVDYVSGGDCVAPPTEEPETNDPIWRALQDAWNGLLK